MCDRIRIIASLSLIVLVGLSSATVFAQPCDPTWDNSSGQAGDPPGLSGPVYALAVFDDGSGPALYAGGAFTYAGGVLVNNVAKWDGSSWSALGSGSNAGTNSVVYALTVYDDGSGPALYAGGFFDRAGGLIAYRIAKWGVERGWSSLSGGLNNSVYALTVFDDGAGEQLYVGGLFTEADGSVPANRIAKWNGTTWSALDEHGLNNVVGSLVGTQEVSAVGPGLYVGGNFTSAGGVPGRNHIVAWGIERGWSPLGQGVNDWVSALAVYNDGSGAKLFAGGEFTIAGFVSANYIAQWDGSSWLPLMSDVHNGVNNPVGALAVFDDGTGSALYAGGEFTMAGGMTASHIAKWNGESWSALIRSTDADDEGTNSDVNALAIATEDSGVGPAIYVGGTFTVAGDDAANRVAAWGGCGAADVPGDFDGDGDVDLDDYAFFYDCMDGPNATPTPTLPVTWEECLEEFDFDTDLDVDMGDFGEFQGLFGSPF